MLFIRTSVCYELNTELIKSKKNYALIVDVNFLLLSPFALLQQIELCHCMACIQNTECPNKHDNSETTLMESLYKKFIEILRFRISFAREKCKIFVKQKMRKSREKIRKIIMQKFHKKMRKFCEKIVDRQTETQKDSQRNQILFIKHFIEVKEGKLLI